ncbi:hypothetical protein C4D60_Mb03t03400 [Musa balbisiana]|uniref:Uncharacterized protein n=1 Tax=Musa balbisiana TaxID=52838 RepID=A0A4S8J7K6_MUSBA|nr:hypothetical protein C4D60_Mb03t03400 [Musa balbisiana]
MESGSDDPSELARGRRAVLSAHLATDRCSFGLTPALERSSALSLEASPPSGNLGESKSYFTLGIIQAIAHDAHPMGVLVSALSAVSLFHPDAYPALRVTLLYTSRPVSDALLYVSQVHEAYEILMICFVLRGQDLYNSKHVRDRQIVRVLGKVPTIAASAYLQLTGGSPVLPSNNFSYSENFLYRLDSLGNRSYVPNHRLSRVLGRPFILHAEHEMNCSTAAVRHLASSLYFTVNLVYL